MKTIPEEFARFAKTPAIRSYELTAECGDRLLSALVRCDGNLREWADELTPFYFYDGFRYLAVRGREVEKFQFRRDAEAFVAA